MNFNSIYFLDSKTQNVHFENRYFFAKRILKNLVYLRKYKDRITIFLLTSIAMVPSKEQIIKLSNLSLMSIKFLSLLCMNLPDSMTGSLRLN